ncbi:hypothetical protein KR044_002043, partial [Drosophila immigrans]
YSNRDLTVALCERRNGPSLYLATAYLPYEEKDPPSESIRALIQHAQKEGTDLILGCDANAHNTFWGSKDTNERGEPILTYGALVWWEAGHTDSNLNNLRNTDGSKTIEGTGSGVFSEDLATKLSFRLPDWCSVFQAEIYAVWQATKLV